MNMQKRNDRHFSPRKTDRRTHCRWECEQKDVLTLPMISPEVFTEEIFDIKRLDQVNFITLYKEKIFEIKAQHLEQFDRFLLHYADSLI